jgi:hypothetical protein
VGLKGMKYKNNRENCIMEKIATGYNYQLLFSLMKLRRMIWAGHVESIGNDDIVQTFLGKL